MLKQRIDSILNSEIPPEESSSGSKESKGDFESKHFQDSNEFSFINAPSPTSCTGSSLFGQQPDRDDTCSFRAEEKTSMGETSGIDSKTNRGIDTDADADTDAILRNQEAAAAFTKKLKDDHRAGLNKLKTALTTNRAQKIGELKTLRREKEDNGEPVFEIDREIHAVTEGDVVCLDSTFIVVSSCDNM
jgi:hypothetical protein